MHELKNSVKSCVMQVGIWAAEASAEEGTCRAIPRGRYVAYRTLLSARDLCFLYALDPTSLT